MSSILFIISAALIAGCATSPAPRKVPSQQHTSTEAPQHDVSVGQEQVAWGSLILVQFNRQIEPLDQREVRLRGIYRQADVRKRADDSNPVYRGHVLLELADEHVVFVEPPWSDEAIRPSSEIAEYEGQIVELRGTLHHRCPGPPPPAGAAIIAPCVTNVSAVQAAGLGDECSQFSAEARACRKSGKTWGRHAEPYCGGARPNPEEERRRIEQEQSTCRCYSPDALRQRAQECARRP